jgi:hypothetical protein
VGHYRTFPTLREALTRFGAGLERIRATGVFADQNLEVMMHTLETVNRYQSIGESLEEGSRVMQTLELNRYKGDYAL